jgi:hypothetical protein
LQIGASEISAFLAAAGVLHVTDHPLAHRPGVTLDAIPPLNPQASEFLLSFPDM